MAKRMKQLNSKLRERRQAENHLPGPRLLTRANYVSLNFTIKVKKPVDIENPAKLTILPYYA
jgi:hypothetical protein